MKCELTYTLEELGGNRPTVYNGRVRWEQTYCIHWKSEVGTDLYTGRVRWELTYTLEERGGNRPIH